MKEKHQPLPKAGGAINCSVRHGELGFGTCHWVIPKNLGQREHLIKRTLGAWIFKEWWGPRNQGDGRGEWICVAISQCIYSTPASELRFRTLGLEPAKQKWIVIAPVLSWKTFSVNCRGEAAGISMADALLLGDFQVRWMHGDAQCVMNT